MKKCLLGAVKVSVAFILVILAVYFFRFPLLHLVSSFLKVDNASKGADLIFLLAGDPLSRVPRAAELLKAGYADKIALADVEKSPHAPALTRLGYTIPDQSSLSLNLLMENGVEKKSIIRLSASPATSTRDEAEIVRNHVGQMGLKHIIIVTSSSHTRRALWIFRRALENHDVRIEAASALPLDFDENRWWASEEGFLTYFNEYLKLLYYLLYY